MTCAVSATLGENEPDAIAGNRGPQIREVLHSPLMKIRPHSEHPFSPFPVEWCGKEGRKCLLWLLRTARGKEVTKPQALLSHTHPPRACLSVRCVGDGRTAHLLHGLPSLTPLSTLLSSATGASWAPWCQCGVESTQLLAVFFFPSLLPPFLPFFLNLPTELAPVPLRDLITPETKVLSGARRGLDRLSAGSASHILALRYQWHATTTTVSFTLFRSRE